MNKIIFDVEQIVLLMIGQKKSIKDLAKFLNMDKSILTKWFFGDTDTMTLSDLKAICTFIHADHENFILHK